MKEKIECVVCDGVAILRQEERSIVYKKEDYKVFAHFYKCQKCGEQFTTEELDSLTINQVYNKYRSINNILFPEELTRIRERYGLTASSMSTILGLGTNGYSNYESGEMPTVALSNLVRAATKPQAFLELLVKSKGSIPMTQFEKALHAIRQKKNHPALTHDEFFKSCPDINEYSGYRKPNIKVIGNLCKWILQECKSEFNDRLKLNKIFFYIDFYHYKKTAKSITGLPYRAIQYGPVPTCYDNLITNFLFEDVISSIWIDDSNGGAREIFQASSSPNTEIFTIEESNSIKMILGKFKDISSWHIVDLSHKEDAWIKNEVDKRKISYQEYAFRLRNV